MNILKKLRLDSIEQVLCNGIMVSLVLLLFVQVIARYVFSFSISWAEEMSRFCLLAFVYISSSLGVKNRNHIRVTAHLKLLPQKAQAGVFVLSELVWFAFNLFVIVESIRLIIAMGDMPMITASLMIDMRYIYAIIPFGFVLQCIRMIQNWQHDLRNYRKRKEVQS